MDRVLDLRSDTVTKPTKAMRNAMMDAVVGDDILRDDPTVLELERLAADMLGKEESFLIPISIISRRVPFPPYLVYRCVPLRAKPAFMTLLSWEQRFNLMRCSGLVQP